ncbi:hypothetical protein [Ensifer sp. LCM 4579]|uniref:hypothetical protein n=1 Tax=Ensifer sp. LCM 4579 TaxID=1848292 RepID=UPI0008D99132|nr:hypothetical protein [Ensifer sp. LCM 4579]OHV80975.1 hypothetical protein LCM4579_21100 [Ensifer sp. LCM 4579]
MKAFILSLAMAAFALPAFGQTSDTQASDTQTQGQTGQPSTMTIDNLKKKLSDAGFKEVKVLDATYLVQAQTAEGNRVLMLIDPPATTETTGSTTQQ